MINGVQVPSHPRMSGIVSSSVAWSARARYLSNNKLVPGHQIRLPILAPNARYTQLTSSRFLPRSGATCAKPDPTPQVQWLPSGCKEVLLSLIAVSMFLS